MKNHKIIVFLLFVFFAIQGCKKSKDPVMPPLTFTGENTFGCYVNGHLFVAVLEQDFSGGCGGAVGEYTMVFGNDTIFESLSLGGGNCETNQGIQILLYTNSVKQANYSLDYSLQQPIIPNKHVAWYGPNTGSMTWSTDYIRTGTCELLKFDTINNIASGTFAFEAYSVKDSSTIQVTDGRFDIKFDSFK